MINKLEVGQVYKSTNLEGYLVERKINSMTDDIVYYSMKEGELEYDGSYAISKKHFYSLIGVRV